MSYKTLKGMDDISFPDIYHWQYVETKAGEFFGRRLYEEIRTPIVEYTDLFQRSIGEASDIVNKEMYTFLDRGGRSLTLRPEMTASVIRAVINNNLLAQREPLKLFYSGPMFRAERPQAGRKRQFFFFFFEVVGNPDPFCDAEVIRDLVTFLEYLGLQKNDLTLRLNNVGCNDCRPGYLESLRGFFQGQISDMCKNCRFKFAKNVLRIFDCKNPACRAVAAQAPKVTDHVCQECRTHFDALVGFLDLFDIEYTVDKNIVRGLDYYTSTVFEVTSRKLGAQDALAAGGRYNNLLKELGGPDKGAIGFAIGIERLLICLADILRDYKTGILEKSVYIAYGDSSYISSAQELIARFEKSGLPSYADYDSRSLKSQLKRANKYGFRWVLILNKDEFERGDVTLKDLHAKDDGQRRIPVSRAEERVAELIKEKE